MSFAKLSRSLVYSTVWREPNPVRILWITLLALADADGYVGASVPGLADAARITLPECEEALACLSAPDPYSRSPEHEGRRLEAVAGGWHILNYAAYRDGQDHEERRRQNREAKRRQRERERGQRESARQHDGQRESARQHDGQRESARSAHVEVEVEVDGEVDGEGSVEGGAEGQTRPKARKSTTRVKKWRRFPEDYVPDDEDRRIAAEEGRDLDRELTKIRLHEFARPKSNARATLHSWLRSDYGRSPSTTRLVQAGAPARRNERDARDRFGSPGPVAEPRPESGASGGRHG